MKNFNICIDIDGTITDAYYWLDSFNSYFNTKIAESEVTDYSIPKVLGIEETDYIDFYETIKFHLHSNQELRSDVKNVITKLSLTNNIYFVTARDKSLTLLTHGYLSKHEIPYDDLFVLGSHYKVSTAKELNCHVFIEDNYDNALQLSEAGFKVLLLDTNYNRKPLNENILRVYDWNEIYVIINDMLLQSKAM